MKRIIPLLLAGLILSNLIVSAEDGVMIPIGTVTTDRSDDNSKLEPDRLTLEEIAADFSYRGEGMCIAVIDTGFYTEHESFTLTGNGRLTKEFVDLLSLNAGKTDDPEAEKQSYYINEKIPFAYNYAAENNDVSGLASHGTAVVSAAAGNNALNPEHPSGAAPEAQVVLMKVFSDDTARASQEAVVSAVKDAVTLGVDVICLAFGEVCGSESYGNSLSINSALDAARDAGIIIVSAAGDSTRLGEVSPYNKYAALMASTTDRPDVGTVAYPGSAESVIAVGSAQSNVYTADCFVIETTDGEVRIPYSDTNTLWTLPTGGVSFAKFFDGRELGYEFVPRYGRVEDLEDLDLTGKIAVIERGVITFGEKCRNAAAKGAIGVIVYDNQPDPDTILNVRMDISESPIPAVMISGVSAEKLRSADSIKVALGERYVSLNRETPMPSSYSAWGGTPELGLGIDFLTVGELVECAAPDGGYVSTGGTTVSAARAAGMLACTKERLISDGYSESYASVEALNLLSSSAQLIHSDDEYYSPRKQGSGAAMLSRALDADLLVTSGGSNSARVGEISKNWFTFDITVTNLSDEVKDCEISALVGSDGYNTFRYSDLDSDDAKEKLSALFDKSPEDEISFIDRFSLFKKVRVFPGYENMNVNSQAEGFEPIRFELGAKKSATFTLTFLLDPETVAEYENIFTNGFYVEGFVRVKSGEEEASIPFMGFKGDWGRADALDRWISDDVSAFADQVYIYREYEDGKLILGTDPLTGIQNDVFAFSPYADAGNAVMLNLALLRNITDVRVGVYSDGKLIGERTYPGLCKTYVDYASGMLNSPRIELWDGRAFDNRYYVYPDGDYTLTVSYKVAGDDRVHELAIDIRLDSTPPLIEGYEFGDNKLRIAASDEYKLSKCRVYDEYETEAGFEDGWYDITSLGKYIYIEVFDCAMNSSVTRLVNPFHNAD